MIYDSYNVYFLPNPLSFMISFHEEKYLFTWKEIFFFMKKNIFFHENNSKKRGGLGWRILMGMFFSLIDKAIEN